MDRLVRNEKKELVFLNPEKNEFQLFYQNQLIAQSNQDVTLLKEMEHHPILKLIENNSTSFIRERHMTKTGIVNFRDLGGYLGAKGKQVKHGLFYRAAPIQIKPECKSEVDVLKMKTIFDLRSNDEVKRTPDDVLDNCQYLQYSGIPSFDEDDFDGNLNMEELGTKQEEIKPLDMISIYENLPINNKAYRKLFEVIEKNELPVVFHCSAGKDRTGVAAALILLALGVDEETVIWDYMYSNECRKEENERIYKLTGNTSEEFQKMMNVQQELIEAALRSIHSHYSTLEEYFEKEFGLDEVRLAAFRKIGLTE